MSRIVPRGVCVIRFSAKSRECGRFGSVFFVACERVSGTEPDPPMHAQTHTPASYETASGAEVCVVGAKSPSGASGDRDTD